jgi:hypothetical protein
MQHARREAWSVQKRERLAFASRAPDKERPRPSLTNSHFGFRISNSHAGFALTRDIVSCTVGAQLNEAPGLCRAARYSARRHGRCHRTRSSGAARVPFIQ